MSACRTLHPSVLTLHAYGLGKLDDASAKSVNNHLGSCSVCQHRVAGWSSDSFVGWLRDAHGWPDSPAPVISSTGGRSMRDGGECSAPAIPASSLPPGLADHPDYDILRELGHGGTGVVYLAQNRLRGRMEALKVVSGDLIRRRGVLDRFLCEIRNAARLHHPNVVTAYSASRLGESLVLAMEYIQGLDLGKLVEANGALAIADACSYAHQAALGLQYAHEHGMVHRDIKPSHLMLARAGNHALIKVLDFGQAKVHGEGPVEGGLTHEGQMLGAPEYIAPEQIDDARRADIRADLYSLGCTLYYLLAGAPPFQGASHYDILQAHHSMEATPLNLVRPEVPPELAALVAKMMAKHPERRFQEPKEVAQALSPFFNTGGFPVVGEHSRRRFQFGLMHLVVACALGFWLCRLLWDSLPGNSPAFALQSLRSTYPGERERGARDLQLAVMLHSLGPEELAVVITAFLIALRDQELGVRTIAAHSLFSIVFDFRNNSRPLPQTQAVVAGWLDAMKDSDPEVRRLAALSLANIYFTFTDKGGPRAPLPDDLARFATVLIEGLGDSNPDIRKWIFQVLGETAPRMQCPPPASLVALLSSSHGTSRARVVATIVKFPQGIDPILPALLGALECDESRSHSPCFPAMFVYVHPTPAALPTLIAGLRNLKRHVRFMAAHLISRIGPDACVAVTGVLPLLEEGYEPRSPFEREHPEMDDPAVAATWALSSIASGTEMAQKAEAGLTKLLANPERPWRHAEAAKALERIRSAARYGKFEERSKGDITQ